MKWSETRKLLFEILMLSSMKAKRKWNLTLGFLFVQNYDIRHSFKIQNVVSFNHSEGNVNFKK